MTPPVSLRAFPLRGTPPAQKLDTPPSRRGGPCAGALAFAAPISLFVAGTHNKGELIWI